MNEEESQQDVQTSEEISQSEEQTYKPFETQAELDSYTDKKIAKALETARGKWNDELENKLQERENEAERLANMSAKERAEAKLKAREDDLTKREHDLQMREYRIEAQKQLSDYKLPADFVEFVLTDDADTTLERIKQLASHIDDLHKKWADEFSNTNSPKDNAGFQANGMSASDIASFAAKTRLIK